MRRQLLYLLIPILLTSCAINDLPRPSEFQKDIHGSKIIIYWRSSNKNMRTAGELIAVDSSSLYILNGEGVRKIGKTAISVANMKIASTSESQAGYSLWASLLPVTTISHGFVLLLTFPLNLINLIVVNIDLSTAYKMNYPEDITWYQLRKFARYPQGIPPGVSISRIE